MSLLCSIYCCLIQYYLQIKLHFTILQSMDEEQDYLLEDEPLKVLNLFPKRQIETFNIDFDKFNKLFDALCCSICQDIFNNPVYLKCSHRFCKQCLQKYIRTNTKKSCPNCRGGLTTKRDLHLDFGIDSLINFAFGDAKKLSKDIEVVDNAELEIRRVSSKKSQKQSMRETRLRARTDIPEEPTYAIKKMKLNDGEEVRRRSKKQLNLRKQQSKERIDDRSEFDSNVSIKVQNDQPIIPAISPVRINQIKSKKKTIQFIQIKSNSENDHLQSKEERRSQKSQPKEEMKQQTFNIPKQEPIPIKNQSKDIIQKEDELSKRKKSSEKKKEVVSEKKIQSKELIITPIKEVIKSAIKQKKLQPFKSSKQKVEVESKKKGRKQIVKEKMVLRQKQNSKEKEKEKQKQKQQQKPQQKFQIDQQQKRKLTQIKQIFKTEFGQHYINKIIPHINYNWMVELTFKKRSADIFTPQIPQRKVKVSIKANISAVIGFLAHNLNVDKQYLRVWIDAKGNGNLVQITNSGLTLYEADEKYWKKPGIEILDMTELIEELNRIQRKTPKEKVRTIYYQVQFKP